VLRDRDLVLCERDLAKMAETFREMAGSARDLRTQLEFAERAERYEIALSAMKRAKAARVGKVG
jgi:hypothetical protein